MTAISNLPDELLEEIWKHLYHQVEPFCIPDIHAVAELRRVNRAFRRIINLDPLLEVIQLSITCASAENELPWLLAFAKLPALPAAIIELRMRVDTRGYGLETCNSPHDHRQRHKFLETILSAVSRLLAACGNLRFLSISGAVWTWHSIPPMPKLLELEVDESCTSSLPPLLQAAPNLSSLVIHGLVDAAIPSIWPAALGSVDRVHLSWINYAIPLNVLRQLPMQPRVLSFSLETDDDEWLEDTS